MLERLGEGRIMLQLIKKRKNKLARPLAMKELPAEGCSRTRVRKSRYSGETLQSPIHCYAWRNIIGGETWPSLYLRPIEELTSFDASVSFC